VGLLDAGAAQAVTFTVSTTADTEDASASDGLCLDASFECSLRAAITEANRTAEPDSIQFAIPGGDAQTISVLSALPAVSSPWAWPDPSSRRP
jgi:CSLREA domain-containing protein